MNTQVIFLLTIMTTVVLSECQGQTYNYPPPPPQSMIEPVNRDNFTVPFPSRSTIVLDTSRTMWSHRSIDTLSRNHGIVWATILEDRTFGKMTKSDRHFFTASSQYYYTKGKPSSCDLIIDVLNLKGSLNATSRKSTLIGFSLVSMASANDFAYLMFQESLSSSDRDLYIAKIDTNANIIWSTKIGKRFGAFGNGLLQVLQNGNLIALSSHLGPVFVDVVDSRTGTLEKTQRLEFPHNLDLQSFIINQAGHLVAIATQNYYIDAKKFNAVLIFELDNDLKVIRQQLVDTDLQDWAQDIVQRPDGNYIFLVNSEFESQNYKEQFEMHILGIIDSNFKILEQQSVEIDDDGMNSRFYLFQNNVYLFQRSPKGFNLLVLKPDLQLKEVYKNQEGYRDPVFLNIDYSGKIWIGGNWANTWLAEIDLTK